MAQPSLNAIFKAIGSLEAEVASLRRDIGESDAANSKINEAAAASRAGIHRRMDDLVKKTSAIEADLSGAKVEIGGIKDDLVDVKQVTDEVTRWRLMGIGALGVTGISAAAIASIVTAYWSKIVKALVG